MLTDEELTRIIRATIESANLTSIGNTEYVLRSMLRRILERLCLDVIRMPVEKPNDAPTSD